MALTLDRDVDMFADESPRKRQKVLDSVPREPLQAISPNVGSANDGPTLGGFVLDDDSEVEELPDEQPHEEQFVLIDEDYNTQRETVANESLPTVDGIDTSEPLRLHIEEDVVAAQLPYFSARTCSGNELKIRPRLRKQDKFYGDMAAARSKTQSTRAQKDYYGIDIHRLMDEGKAAMAAAETSTRTTEAAPVIQSTETDDTSGAKQRKVLLWTEKYRARKFTDLLGDERTHRTVLRWFKSWDSIVFPHAQKPRVKTPAMQDKDDEDKHLRKILLLAGPPGLGKTTLAHICARQAGYETKEINASDERSKDVVNGRVRDMVGTENVRSIDSKSSKKAARPLCVVIDEVDGVVSGNSGSGGEGGFIKALIDLVALDQRNSNPKTSSFAGGPRRKKKGENFRLLRPLVLICNDVYHPSLRPLRQSPLAEVIHVRRPPLGAVIPRLGSILELEGIKSDSDGVRTLCEAAWGVTSKKKGGAGSAGGGGVSEGDIRSILVIGEWVAGKLRTSPSNIAQRLTRQWVEKNIVGELAHGGGAARSLGRGGGKECVQRVFAYNAGFPVSSSGAALKTRDVTEDLLGSGGATNAARKATLDRFREMVEASGEEERIVQDVFTGWPGAPFQDTGALVKPCAAADWMHFSTVLAHRVHTAQEWDLMAYSAYPVVALHSLFAATSTNPTLATTAAQPSGQGQEADSSSTGKTDPFTGPRPDATANELHKQHTATLTELKDTLSLPLRRLFNTSHALATELLPYTLRLLNPSASPVLVGGQASLRRAPEKERASRAATAMASLGVRFDRARVDALASDAVAEARQAGNAGWVLRMVPPLDEAGAFATLDDTRAQRPGGDAGRARYALRLVLETALRAENARREAEARGRRVVGPARGNDEGAHAPGSADGKAVSSETTVKGRGGVKRDFFGRPIAAVTAEGDAIASVPGDSVAAQGAKRLKGAAEAGKARGRSAVWVTYHEGFSNAVRKPITLRELMDGL